MRTIAGFLFTDGGSIHIGGQSVNTVSVEKREIGITTMFVTHDQEEALTLSDKIGILRSRRMVQAGASREVYNNSVDVFFACFLGEANILEGIAANDVLRLHDGSLLTLSH